MTKNFIFPQHMSRSGRTEISGGLTLRQLYAGMAMKELINKKQWEPIITAKESLAYADALIAELDKE